MRKAFVILALFLTVVTAIVWARDDWEARARQRKADYAFMQAMTAFAVDSNDTGLRLMAAAARLAPADLDIAGEQAMAVLSLMPKPDTAVALQAYEALRARFAANPTDYQGGQSVATAARALRKIDDLVWVWQTLDSLFPAKTDPAMNLANAYVLRYVQTGDTANYQHALAIFNRIEAGTGKDLGLSTQKVRAYALRNDTMAIIAELDSVIARMPGDSRASLVAASIYDNLGLDTLALLNYRRACAVDSTNGRAFAAIANFYRQRGDSVAYDHEVFRALKSQDLEFDTKYEILRGYVSKLYADTTQWPRIDDLFAVMQQTNPGEARLHALYGAFETERDAYGAAAEQFAYATALDPADPANRIGWIQMLQATDSIAAMVRVATDGIDLFADNFYFPIMAASGLQTQKKYTEANELLRKVDISQVNNKKAVSNLLTIVADTYYMIDSLDSAFTTYERAISLDADNFMAYNNAAYFMAQKGRDLDKALKYSRFAVLSEPENPTYLDTYAWVYFKRKEYDEALKQINSALGLYEQADSLAPVDAEPQMNAEVLEHAGDIYFMNGEPDRAVEFWERAAALDPKNELLARKVKHKTYFYK